MAQGSPGSVVHELAARLRRDISFGVLKPGQRLNIEAIKRDQKVSHPSIREALALLSGEGYVSVEGNKGFRVLDSSLEDLRDTTRLRAELEYIGLHWSVENSIPEWRAKVVAAHHILAEVEAELAHDPRAFANESDERNKQFHLALIDNCQSPRLIETVSTFYDLTRRYRLMAYAQSDIDHHAWLHRSTSEHASIMAAALEGNAEGASDILHAHVTKGLDQAEVEMIAWGTAKRNGQPG